MLKDPFGSDDDDLANDTFYEKEPLKSTKPYEEYFDKLNIFFNQYIDKLNDFEIRNDYPIEKPAQNIFVLHQTVYEKNIGVFDLIKTDNKIFNKITSVFVVLDQEIKRIADLFEIKLFDCLIMYGERPENKTAANSNSNYLKDGDAEMETSRMLGVYKQIYELIKRLMSIIFNLLNQLNAILHKEDKLFKTTFKQVSIYSVLDSLGKALSLIHTIDCLVKENENLRNHWNFFKRMLKIVRSEPAKYNVTEAQIKAFEKILVRIDKTILSGNCFRTCLSQNFDINNQTSNPAASTTKKGKPDQNLMKNNKELHHFFTNYIKLNISYFQETLCSSTETIERKKFYDFLCLYALYRRIFDQDQDRKLWKTIWAFQKKMPVVVVHCHVLLYISEFLTEITPLSKKSSSADPKNPKEYLKTFLGKMDENMEKDIHGLYIHFCSWVTKVESNMSSNTSFGNEKLASNGALIEERLGFRTKIIMNGILIANQIRNSVLMSLLLHLNERIELPKSLIKAFCLGIQMLVAIKNLINEKQSAFVAPLLTRFISKQIHDIIAPQLEKMKKAAAASKGTEKSDTYSALQLIVQVLRGPASPIRVSALNFCLNFAMTKGTLKENESVDLRYLIWKYEIVANYQYHLKLATDCSFIYWSKDLIPIFFSYMFQNPHESKRCQLLLSCLSDPVTQIRASTHLANNEELFDSYKVEMLESFQKEYIVPVSREIEDFLRISIHHILIDKITRPNPFKDNVKILKRLLDPGRLQVLDVCVDIKDEIARILNERFYNINVLNMHDYQTYEEIRTLAYETFGLELLHVYIPSQTLDQGSLDILQIIRNIQGFVSRFAYNLYNQKFIEISKDSKQLNTIGIQQISDSIQTHGLGILSTNVNFVYTFIKKKFQTFSQFLFDDLIQSPLIREMRFFKENKERLDGMYPFDRADNFYKEIKKLGSFEDGKNFLDKFRVLITTLGNALGFVRLIKSASLNFCSRNIEFIPSIEDIKNFESLASAAKFGASTISAGKDLDEVFLTLKENFSDRTDYLKMLVKVFEGVVQGDENKHLQLFYLIVPSLTINYIEHVLISKEKLIKKNVQEAFITDDGFTLGLAYFLKLLNLNNKYDSLHWDLEVKNKFKKEIDEATSETKPDKISKRQFEELNMQKELSLRKLTMQSDEYELFFFTFQAARILFREA